MKFLYITDDTQIAYSPTRQALGEWVRGRERWLFMGWLYDGKVRNEQHARALLRGVV